MRRPKRPLVVGALLALTVIIGSCVPGSDTPAPPGTPTAAPTDEPTPAPTGVPAPTLASLHMETPTTGWATDLPSGRLLRTTDGGVTWGDASPPHPEEGGGAVYGIEGAGAASAAVAAPPSPGAAEALLEIATYRTADGGRTWEAGGTVSVSGAPAGPAQITFVDADHGWLVVGLGAAAGSHALAIYRTADGGATWELASLTSGMEGESTPGALPFACSKSGIAFVNATTGWAAGACPGGPLFFFVTRDGAETWTRQELPPPPGFAVDLYEACQCSAMPPQVVADGVALFAVGIFEIEPGAALHVTEDGGASWQVRELPIVRMVGRPDFVDPATGFVTDGTVLYATGDGGRTWEEVGPLPVDRDHLVFGVEFADADHGWVTDGERLYATADGGRSWSAVTPGAP